MARQWLLDKLINLRVKLPFALSADSSGQLLTQIVIHANNPIGPDDEENKQFEQFLELVSQRLVPVPDTEILENCYKTAQQNTMLDVAEGIHELFVSRSNKSQ